MNSEIRTALEQLSDVHARLGLGPIEFGVPATDILIDQVQDKLGVKLHEDYREFLKTYGALRIGNAQFFGTWSDSPNDERGGTILGETIELRRECSLPHDLVPTHGSLYMSFLCLNCSTVPGSQKLMYYDNEEMSTFACEHSSSFSEFLLKDLQGSVRALEQHTKKSDTF